MYQDLLKFLDEWGHLVDWVGLSSMLLMMKSTQKLDVVCVVISPFAPPPRVSYDAWNRCRSRGIRMKLNTVVCKANLDDDMSELVLKLRPERWKIFEVLPVEGQNDGDVDDLLLDEAEFQTWVNRHAWIAGEGIQFVPESNELMRGSYAMMDALGRFYSNSGVDMLTVSILDIVL